MKSQILLMAFASCLIFAPVASISSQIPPPHLGPTQSREWLGRRDAILARERARLAILAPDLAKPPEAAADGSSRFVPLAEVVPARPRGSETAEVEQARGEAARALFELAGVAAKGPPAKFAFADECVREVLERQPDHAEARRLLGFVPRDGGWATPYAADQLGRGKVSDPTFGWVPADWVPHLRRGELPGKTAGRWLPAAEADALRRDWAGRWEITTEHFKIETDVPLSEAISFGRRLEDFHQLFFAMMADLIGPDLLPLAQRYRSATLKPSLSRKPPHRVFYFATRDEYIQHLIPAQGDAAKLSLGIYLPKKNNGTFGGISYFFNDVNGQLDINSTLYHEASHQLLFESAGSEDYARNVGNYWVFEGLGTYFETVQVEPDGSLRVGGMIGPRLRSARDRLIRAREFVPIDLLVAMTPPRFLDNRDVYLHYAESMALAVFLMQAHEGAYREGFIDYARDAYKGRFRGGSGRTLEDRVGVRYPDLDREFLDYLGDRSRK